MNSKMTNEPLAGSKISVNPFEKGGPFYKNIYFILFILGAIAITVVRPFMRHEPAPPKVISLLPNFSLKNQQGQIYGTNELNGKVYVASFLFTRCQTVCPLIAGKLKELQSKFAEAEMPVQIVSFSVDPEFDVPEVLLEYSQKWSNDKGTWVFLTGETAAMQQVMSGFAMSLEQPKADGSESMIDIAHSAKLVLVDWKGAIRGYYDSNSEGLDEVFHRSKHVLKQMQEPGT